jgi:hypothetical protein
MQQKLSALAPVTWDHLRLMSTPNHWRHFGALGATASGTKVSSGQLAIPSRQSEIDLPQADNVKINDIGPVCAVRATDRTGAHDLQLSTSAPRWLVLDDFRIDRNRSARALPLHAGRSMPPPSF